MRENPGGLRIAVVAKKHSRYRTSFRTGSIPCLRHFVSTCVCASRAFTRDPSTKSHIEWQRCNVRNVVAGSLARTQHVALALAFYMKKHLKYCPYALLISVQAQKA